MKREDESRLFRFTLKHSVFLASAIWAAESCFTPTSCRGGCRYSPGR